MFKFGLKIKSAQVHTFDACMLSNPSFFLEKNAGSTHIMYHTIGGQSLNWRSIFENLMTDSDADSSVRPEIQCWPLSQIRSQFRPSGRIWLDL